MNWKPSGQKLLDTLRAKWPAREAGEILEIVRGELLRTHKPDLAGAADAIVDDLRGEFDQPGPPILIIQEAAKLARKQERTMR